MTNTIRMWGAQLLDTFVRSLALFAALNTVLGWVRPPWDANWLWIGGAWLSPGVTSAFVAAFAAAVLLGCDALRWGRRATTALGLGVALICLGDALVFVRLGHAGAIRTDAVLSLSLVAALLLAAWTLTRPVASAPKRGGLARRARALTVPCALAGLVVLAHLVSFGATDYRRDADAAVVLGAAVRPDGSPSLALFDRTRTACDLYHAGLVQHLVLSGGRDPNAPVSEPECMRRIAVSMGVPEGALVLDEKGDNTLASVRNTKRIAQARGWSRVLMVSHDYHLARIKLVSERVDLCAYTVPADESQVWDGKSRFVLREVLAWGYAFARIDRS